MILRPSPTRPTSIPFTARRTLNLNCFVHDPITGEHYSRDPRYIAQKAEEYLLGHRHGRHLLHRARGRVLRLRRRPLRPEPALGHATPSTRSRRRGTPAGTRGPNLGYKPRYKEGYFPVPPMDHYQDLRSEMTMALEAVRHPGRGPAPRGRHRRPGRDRHPLRLAGRDGRQADAVQVRGQERGPPGTARRRRSCPSRSSRTTARACTCTSRCGRTASPCSSTRPATPACRTWPAGTSAACSSHAPAMLRLRQPDDQQLQAPGPRLRGPGQPRLLASATARRRCASRSTRKSPKAKRIEFRCPDPSANPYLAFSAMLMAGLDGIANRIEPPDPVDKDLYDLPPEELRRGPARSRRRWRPPSTPSRPTRTSCGRATSSPTTSSTPGCPTSATAEVDALRLRPHPWEFHLYYDI